MSTERAWIMENAAEHVAVLYNQETGEQECLAIMDGPDVVLNDIDKHFALGLAARLVELAIELPEVQVKLPRATLAREKRIRRLKAIDEQLREVGE